MKKFIIALMIVASIGCSGTPEPRIQLAEVKVKDIAAKPPETLMASPAEFKAVPRGSDNGKSLDIIANDNNAEAMKTKDKLIRLQQYIRELFK